MITASTCDSIVPMTYQFLLARQVLLTWVGCIAERQVGAAPVSPIKARFVSDSGAQLSVVVRPAAEIKPTFLQVTSLRHCHNSSKQVIS